ncbi:sensor histidine kinase [Fredinandcohnia humi]
MKQALLYWGFITLLGIVHLHALFLTLPWHIPIYGTSLFVVGVTYLLQKRTFFRILSLDVKWNILFFLLQLTLPSIYVAVKPTLLYIIPLILFVGIEYARFSFSNRLFNLNEEIKKFDEQRQQFNDTFRVVRSERHDFLKHVSAVHFMLENGRNEEAKTYLDEIVDGYKETNLSIKGERGVVAGVLHQMYRRAKKAGIEIVYDFDLPLSTLPLTDSKIVTLLGNILSNSIDACEEWQNERKQQAMITIQFYKRSGLHIIQCKNNSLPIPTNILDNLFQTFGHTTKANGHEGLGTKIIQDIVEGHSGFLDFVYKEQEFALKIKIPAIK